MNPTKPTIEQRRRVLAALYAAYLSDLSEKEIADELFYNEGSMVPYEDEELRKVEVKYLAGEMEEGRYIAFMLNDDNIFNTEQAAYEASMNRFNEIERKVL